MTSARLLVVDDNSMNREMLRRRFTRDGHTVEVADGGQAALDVMAAQPIDLLLLDIEMPGLTGLDVLRAVRARHSAAEVPVIMVSARRDSEMIVEALHMGANDYVTKPVDFAVARARVEAQLARRQLAPVEQRVHGLTGLPNRLALAGWWADGVGPPGPSGALWINVDRFRAVNHGLGRDAGDALLRQVAARLAAFLSDDRLLVHLDGDDFVFLQRAAAPDDLEPFAALVLGALRQPFSVGDHQLMLKASIGLALGEPDGTADALLADADAALYRAKSLGGGQWTMFDHTVRSRAAERLRLETELQRAIETDSFELLYQPIVELANRTVRGFEVLARWTHPTRGDIPPAAFIPIAEETGLITPFGEQILRRACRQLRVWQDRGALAPPGGLSVNVSGLQLRDPGWVDSVAAILAETGVNPGGLTLEITETVLLEDMERIPVVLRRIRDLGVGLSLDDFGTGYSSLGYLQKFAMNTLKVDRSFVGQLTGPGSSPGVVQAILQLAETLGMTVVAEGIESLPQFDQLRELGCVYGQGYFLSRPLTVNHAEELIAAHPTPAVSTRS